MASTFKGSHIYSLARLGYDSNMAGAVVEPWWKMVATPTHKVLPGERVICLLPGLWPAHEDSVVFHAAEAS